MLSKVLEHVLEAGEVLSGTEAELRGGLPVVPHLAPAGLRRVLDRGLPVAVPHGVSVSVPAPDADPAVCPDLVLEVALTGRGREALLHFWLGSASD